MPHYVLVRTAVLTLSILALAPPLAGRAQDPPARVIVADPTEIRVSGVGSEKVKRLIALTLTGNPELSTITLRPTNLRAVEGDDAESAPPIELSSKTIRLRPGMSNEVFMIFDLKGLDHGEYKGKLQVLNGEDLIKELPLLVRVRHAWPWPLTILLSGVLLGLGISWYRSRGQTQDQLLSRIDELQDRVADTTIRKEFRDKISEQIVIAEAALKQPDMVAAAKALDDGEAIAFRWLSKRSDWEDLFKYIQTLRAELQPFTNSSNTVQVVLVAIDGASRDAASDPTPDILRTKLTGWRAQVARFQKTQALLSGLDRRRRDAPPQLAAAWESRIRVFKERLDALAPSSDGLDFQALETDIDAASRELDLVIQQAQAQAAMAAPVIGDGVNAVPLAPAAITNPPVVNLTAVPTATRSLAKRASARLSSIDLPRMGRSLSKLRLVLFRWFGYVAPVSVFVYTGMVQFYQGNPSFGSSSQYVALFLWGFGADATGTKVQDLIRNASNRTEPPAPVAPSPRPG